MSEVAFCLWQLSLPIADCETSTSLSAGKLRSNES